MGDLKSYRIGDLITIPLVETVIQLEQVQVRDRERTHNLLRQFVITREIEQAFQVVFHHIRHQQGLGGFVKGNYGSGKSHFLAVLYLLLSDPELSKILPHPVFRPLQENRPRIVPVKIALHHFSAAEYLESIVFGAAEKALTEVVGEEIWLRSGSLLLEHFEKYVLPQHPDFLKSHRLTPREWRHLRETQPRQAMQSAYAFIQSHNIPLKPVFDRRQALQILLNAMQQAQAQGIFFLLDELSEFLKSKQNPAAFNEDLRFLQFLGEIAQQPPSAERPAVFLLAALQENIEKTGYIEQDLLLRIKDRFPVRIYLSAHHVRELISQRLIQKKPEAAQLLPQIYRRFQEAFAPGAIEAQTFEAIYPVHPATIDLLETLTPIFSQHRGVVDFIYHQLAGDSNRNWPGMLQLPATTLLTPDTIFDHFQERLSSLPEFVDYVDVVYPTVQKEIATLFPEETDRQLATKVLKILILIEISPTFQRPTAGRLTEMIAQPISPLESSINYSYMEEVILKQLTQESTYVTRFDTGGKEPVYGISLEVSLPQLIKQNVRDLLKQPLDFSDWLKTLLPTLSSPQIPFNRIASGSRKKFQFLWQNTRREGWVMWKPNGTIDGLELEELVEELNRTERDFALVLMPSPETDETPLSAIFPGAPESRFAGALVFWFPRRPMDDEWDVLRRYFAYWQLASTWKSGSNLSDRQKQQIVEERLQSLQAEVVAIVESLYLEGRLANCQGWLPLRLAPFYPDFKTMLNQIFSPILQEIFPRHSEVMPTDTMAPFVADKLFDQLIRPGSLHRAEARERHLDVLIETFLTPLKMVALENERYVLRIDPNKQPLLKAILDRCQGDQIVSLYALYWRFRKGEWGLSPEVFRLLMGALLATGRLTSFLSGNSVVFHSLSQLEDGGIDGVGRGKLVREEVQNALHSFRRLNDFADIPPGFSFTIQEMYWRRMRQLRETLQQLLNRWRELTERMQNYPFYETLKEKLTPIPEALLQFSRHFKPSLSSTEGLEQLVSNLGLQSFAGLPENVAQLENTIQVLEGRFGELNQIYHYLSQPAFKQSGSRVVYPEIQELQDIRRKLTTSLVLEPEALEQLSRRFYQVRRQYIALYQKLHQQYYQQSVFQERGQLEQSVEIQLLKRLHHSPSIVPDPDWIAVQQQLLDLPVPCGRLVEKQLTHRAFCECGFVPGQQAPQSRQQSLRQMAASGIRSFLEQLQSRFRWILEEYVQNLRQIKKPLLADQLEKVLAFPVQQMDSRTNELLHLLNQEVLEHIEQAVQGRVLILRRDWHQLEQALVGRQLTVKEIRDIFDKWLTEGHTVDENTFVHIRHPEKFPRLDPANYHDFTDLIHEEGRRFFEAFWLLRWAVQHARPAWENWVQEQYRFRHGAKEKLQTAPAESSWQKDWEQVALALVEKGTLEQLEKLIQPAGQPLPELARFIEKETMWEELSRKATKALLRQLAPTETPVDLLQALGKNLSRHSRRQQWEHLRLLHDYLMLLELIHRKGEHPLVFYLQDGWQLPLLKSVLEEKNRRLELIPDEKWKSVTQKIQLLEHKLTFPVPAFSKKSLPMAYFHLAQWPRRLTALLHSDEHPLVAVIIDALRMDAWKIVEPLLADALHNRPILFTAAVEVNSPTTTEINRPVLLEQLLNATGALQWHLVKLAEKPSAESEVLSALEKKLPLLVLNVTILDRLLHERREPLGTIYQVLQVRMKSLFIPVLKRIPPHAFVLVTADHGFVAKEAHFQHGGDSFFEKIVPLTLWGAAES